MPRLFLFASVLSLLLFRVGGVEAQWVQTNGPLVPGEAPIVSSNSILFAFGGPGNRRQIYRSTDDGANWQLCRDTFYVVTKGLLTTFGNVVLAGGVGILRSSNNGNTWSPSNGGWLGLIHGTILDFATDGTDVYASSYAGTAFSAIYVSHDSGVSWDNFWYPVNSDVILSFAVHRPYCFAVTKTGVYRSTSGGQNWSMINAPSPSVQSIRLFGRLVFAIAQEGLYVSRNMGNTWDLINPASNGKPMAGIATLDSFLFAWGDHLFRSADTGKSWQQIDSGLQLSANSDASICRREIFVADRYLYSSSDLGNNWSVRCEGFAPVDFASLVPLGKTIIARTCAANEGEVFCSQDQGDSWIMAEGMPNSCVRSKIVEAHGKLFALSRGVSVSFDSGQNWQSSGAHFLDSLSTTCLFSDSGNLFVGTDKGLFKSTNDGKDWALSNTGLRVSAVGVVGMVSTKAGLFALESDSVLYRSTDGGFTWILADSGLPYHQYWSGRIFNIGETLFYSSQGLYRSTNNGMSWVIDTSSVAFTDIAVTGPYLFGCYGGYGVLLSSDSGESWRQVNNDGLRKHGGFTSIAVMGTDLFAVIDYNSVWRRSISEIILSSGVTSATQPHFTLTSHPNPLSFSTTINFAADAIGPTQITIHNLLGTEVSRLFSGELGAGEHSFTWDARGFPPRMYECVVRMNGRVERVPMILER